MSHNDSWDTFIAKLNGSNEAANAPALVQVLNHIDKIFASDNFLDSLNNDTILTIANQNIEAAKGEL